MSRERNCGCLIVLKVKLSRASLDRGNCGVVASVHVLLDLGMTLFFSCYANLMTSSCLLRSSV